MTRVHNSLIKPVPTGDRHRWYNGRCRWQGCPVPGTIRVEGRITCRWHLHCHDSDAADRITTRLRNRRGLLRVWWDLQGIPASDPYWRERFADVDPQPGETEVVWDYQDRILAELRNGVSDGKENGRQSD